MNETCIKHALNMPDIGGCPYCEIDRLKAELEEAYLAGAATMREKAAEVANSMAIDCPSDKCPVFTDMDDCIYKETGFCIVAAIRKIEVE